ncbi:MAG: response regulator [Opitutales bacterium]
MIWHETGVARALIDLPHSHRVVLAEDDAGLRRVSELLLQRLGQNVMVVADGAEAVAAFRSFRPELVFLDLEMPVMDGLEAARMIRSQAGGRAVRLVALTGQAEDQAIQQTQEAGFDAHLVKPVAPHRLVELLKGLPTAETTES